MAFVIQEASVMYTTKHLFIFFWTVFIVTCSLQSAQASEVQKSVCQFDVVELAPLRQIPDETVLPVGMGGYVVKSCTGVIAGPHHFLTAAHCSDALTTKGRFQRVGRIFCDDGRDNRYVRPKDARVSRKWKRATGDKSSLGLAMHDVALLQTRTDFTSPAINLPLDREELRATLLLNQCGLIGFGGKRYDRGELPRRQPLTLVASDMRHILADAGAILDHENIIYTGYRDVLVRGDSGGPIVCLNPQGQPRLVGIMGGRPEPLSVVGLSSQYQITLPDGSVLGDQLFINVGASVGPLVDRVQARAARKSIQDRPAVVESRVR